MCYNLREMCRNDCINFLEKETVDIFFGNLIFDTRGYSLNNNIVPITTILIGLYAGYFRHHGDDINAIIDLHNAASNSKLMDLIHSHYRNTEMNIYYVIFRNLNIDLDNLKQY